MLDIQYLFDHPMALRWSARKMSDSEMDNPGITPFDIDSIVLALQNALDPIFFHHIYSAKHPSLPLSLIRIQIQNSFSHVLPPPRRIFYMALPFSSSFIFHTVVRDTSHDILLQAMEMALSSKRKPVQFSYTNLTVRNIETMVKRRGASRHPSALGAWRIYADNEVDTSPIDPQEKVENHLNNNLDTSASDDVLEKRKHLIDVRFGKNSDGIEDVLDRLAFRLQEICLDDDGKQSTFRPSVTLVFEGGDVLGGLRELCEKAIADVERIPSWLTGEDGVTEGVIYDGLLQVIG